MDVTPELEQLTEAIELTDDDTLRGLDAGNGLSPSCRVVQPGQEGRASRATLLLRGTRAAQFVMPHPSIQERR